MTLDSNQNDAPELKAKRKAQEYTIAEKRTIATLYAEAKTGTAHMVARRYLMIPASRKPRGSNAAPDAKPAKAPDAKPEQASTVVERVEKLERELGI